MKKIILIIGAIVLIAIVVAGIIIFGDNRGKDIPQVLNQDPLNILPSQIPKLPALIYGGQVIGEQYDDVSGPFKIDNKIGYHAIKDGKHFIVYGGVEGNKYNMVWMQSSENLLYIAEKSDKKYVVVFNNEESEEYERITHGVKIIEGKPTFIASIDDSTYLIFGNDRFELENFDYFFTEMDGKLAYGRTRSNNDHVIYMGERFESGSDTYQKFYSQYRDLVEPEYEKNMRLYDSQITWKEDYDRIMYSDMKEIDGKLAYMVQKKNGNYVLVYDGKESNEYDWINMESIKIINGKLTYVADKKAQASVVVYGNDESEVYWSVNSPIFYIDNKLVYFVDYKDHDHMLIIDGDKYDFDGYLCSIIENGDKLAFTITEEDCWLVYE